MRRTRTRFADSSPGTIRSSTWKLAPWAVAGALLLTTGASVAAQDATPPAETGLEVVAEEAPAGEAITAEGAVPAEGAVAEDAVAAEEGAAPAAAEGAAPAADEAAAPAADEAAADDGGGRNRDREGRGGGQEPTAVPAVGVGPGAVSGGFNPLAFGAAIGAFAATAAALRGRFANR